MNRRNARELVLHLIFAGEYSGMSGEELLETRVNSEAFESLEGEYDLYSKLPDEKQEPYVAAMTRGVMAHLPELDSYIEKYAVGWNVARISRITKCILRLAMYETLYMQIPVAASVNEALEFAKQYDSEQAAAFVNGVMGSFAKNEIGK
jgi:N utilization substance protein B